MRTFATQQDIDRIQDALTRLGWSQEQFKAWLRSPRSPLAKRINGVRIAPVDPKLRTLYETNRVWWALKGMLQAHELWRQNAPAK